MANGILAASQLEMLTLSGTGVITIVPPNTNTNRTLTLPDSTGTVATAESTLTQFSASGSAPVFAARAWVNFNGTGTVAIRASGNVSSITDNGTGLYTVNLTTAMPDASGCVVAFAYKSATNSGDYRTIATGYNTISSGSFGIQTGTAQTDNVVDTPVITAAIFR